MDRYKKLESDLKRHHSRDTKHSRKTMSEIQDLEVLRDKQRRIKENCFSYLDNLTKTPADKLYLSGHTKGLAQAMLDSFLRYQKELDNLVKTHIKKYPD